MPKKGGTTRELPLSAFAKLWQTIDPISTLQRATIYERKYRTALATHKAASSFQLEHHQEFEAEQAKKIAQGRLSSFLVKQLIQNTSIVIGKISDPPATPMEDQLMTQQWLSVMATQKQALTLDENIKRLEAKDLSIEKEKGKGSFHHAQEQALTALMSGISTPIDKEVNTAQSLPKQGGIMICLSNDQQEKVTMGVYQNRQGIWFYDSKHFSICFPKTETNTTEQLQQQFDAFYKAYQAHFYPNHTQGFMITTVPTVSLTEKNLAEPAVKTSNTLLTQATTHPAKTEKQNFGTPSTDDTPSPDKPQNHNPGRKK